MNSLRSILTNHPFTRDISPRFLEALQECASFQKVGLDEQVFQEGAEASRFHLLHRGSVALQIFVPGTGIKTLQRIGSGEALGWSWLFPPYRWHFTAVAKEPVEMVSLAAGKLRAQMKEDPEFGYEIAIRVGAMVFERLHATRQQLLAQYAERQAAR